MHWIRRCVFAWRSRYSRVCGRDCRSLRTILWQAKNCWKRSRANVALPRDIANSWFIITQSGSHFRQMIGRVDITFVGDALAALAITLRIARRPRGWAIHVTIEHAERGG